MIRRIALATVAAVVVAAGAVGCARQQSCPSTVVPAPGKPSPSTNPLQQQLLLKGGHSSGHSTGHTSGHSSSGGGHTTSHTTGHTTTRRTTTHHTSSWLFWRHSSSGSGCRTTPVVPPPQPSAPSFPAFSDPVTPVPTPLPSR